MKLFTCISCSLLYVAVFHVQCRSGFSVSQEEGVRSLRTNISAYRVAMVCGITIIYICFHLILFPFITGVTIYDFRYDCCRIF